MPGRGQPWRQGQGVQDRIGTSDIDDESILSEDIKDLTITDSDIADTTISESKLDSALQAKVNSGGGGGGPTENNISWDDEFFYADGGIIDQVHWAVDGSANASFTDITGEKLAGGVILFTVTAGVNGQFGGMTTNGAGLAEGGMFVDSNKDYSLRWIFKSLTLTNIIIWAGMFTATPADGTDIATTEAGITEGAYFRSEDGGNWIAVTRLSSTNTTTDTGVSPSGFQTLEITKTGGTTVFKIGGTTVATHNTNEPTGVIPPFLGATDKNQVAKDLQVDTFVVTNSR